MTAGMAAALTELEWRREAAKMVVLVADAPPHGQSPVIWLPICFSHIGYLGNSS